MMNHKTKQCKGCSYGRTPDDMDRCNYCGELFSISDNATVDINKDGFSGLGVKDIDLDNFPEGMTKNKDTELFLKILKEEGNVATCKIYRLNGNLESFYAVLSGNLYLTVHKFLKQSPHLRLFNIYTDKDGVIDESLDNGEDILPLGVYSVSFSKNHDIDDEGNEHADE